VGRGFRGGCSRNVRTQPRAGRGDVEREKLNKGMKNKN
jgi:hypothetical protein